MIARNVEQAHYLGHLIEPELELMRRLGRIVCYASTGGLPEKLSAQPDLLAELQEQGIAAPSYTTLNGVYCMRVAIANHRSRTADFDVLVNETLRIGRQLL
jgi:hypothetical protein